MAATLNTNLEITPREGSQSKEEQSFIASASSLLLTCVKAESIEPSAHIINTLRGNLIDLTSQTGSLFITKIIVPLLVALERTLNAESIPVSQTCMRELEVLACQSVLSNAASSDFAPATLRPMHKVLKMEGGLDAFFSQ